MKNFYSHLVEVESIIVELDKLDLSKEQRHHLASLVDSSLHHTILDAILSQLNESDKRVFIQNIDDNDKTMKFLNEKIDKVEEKIKKAADDLKSEIKKDLKEAGRSK